MFEKIIRSAKNIFTSKEKSFLSPSYSELFELDDELPSPSQNSYDSYLKAYADKLYENSKENLRKLITTKGGINE